MLRLVFPAVSENTSPACILASFLEVLGRKIDNLEDSMDLCLNLANIARLALYDVL